MELSIFSVVGLGMIAALLCLLLRQYRPEYALSASLVCSALLLSAVIAQMTPLFSAIRSVLGRMEGGNNCTVILIKSMGVCYLTQLASDTCKDAGESALAGKIELAGRVAVLILSLPMLESLLQTALGFIG